MRVILLLVIATALFSCKDKKSSGKEEVLGDKEMMVQQGNPVNPDSVLFSFVFMGCNRIDKSDVSDSNTNASTANIPELQRSFNEIAALNPKPAFFFFLGDEVLGLDQDVSVLQTQLQAWQQQYTNTTFSALPGSGIPLIAVPGNHEMLWYHKHKHDKSKDAEEPNQGALAVWMQVMGQYMPSGVTINRVGGPDSLQNLATYSFTYGNTHFIVMNTDTYDNTNTIGMAPASWIAADIVTARKDTAVKHIFLLGHKPAVVLQPLYQWDGENTMDTSVVNAIWPVMDSNQVEAMLSAHSHQYDRLQPTPNGSYQIIAGNGGSPYEHKAAKDPLRQFFGYTIVYVMKNGQVVLQSMGRSVPSSNYLGSIPDSLCTSIRDTVNITWGTSAGTWTPGLNICTK